MHSKFRHLHLKHLREVFIRCRMFWIYLNLNKCLFAVSEGWLLGYIVNIKGIYIDPKIIQAINELNPIVDIKYVQSFFGKINFVRILIQNYASIIKPITKLLRIDQDFEWTPKVQRVFVNIKDSIVSLHILVSPNFNNH